MYPYLLGKMNSAIDCAVQLIWVRSLITEEEEPVSNLWLQKALYYLQGWSLALEKKVAFDQEIQAWKLGPVVKEAYHYFKDELPSFFTLDRLPNQKLNPVPSSSLLYTVAEYYSQFSAFGLANQTHLERLWVEHYQPNVLNLVIPKPRIADYFSNEAFNFPMHRTFLEILQKRRNNLRPVQLPEMPEEESLDAAMADFEVLP